MATVPCTMATPSHRLIARTVAGWWQQFTRCDARSPTKSSRGFGSGPPGPRPNRFWGSLRPIEGIVGTYLLLLVLDRVVPIFTPRTHRMSKGRNRAQPYTSNPVCGVGAPMCGRDPALYPLEAGSLPTIIATLPRLLIPPPPLPVSSGPGVALVDFYLLRIQSVQPPISRSESTFRLSERVHLGELWRPSRRSRGA